MPRIVLASSVKEPEAAEQWFRGLMQVNYSPEDLPELCPLIPEQEPGFWVQSEA